MRTWSRFSAERALRRWQRLLVTRSKTDLIVHRATRSGLTESADGSMTRVAEAHGRCSRHVALETREAFSWKFICRWLGSLLILMAHDIFSAIFSVSRAYPSAAIKANPSRGGGAKPKGLPREERKPGCPTTQRHELTTLRRRPQRKGESGRDLAPTISTQDRRFTHLS